MLIISKVKNSEKQREKIGYFFFSFYCDDKWYFTIYWTKSISGIKIKGTLPHFRENVMMWHESLVLKARAFGVEEGKKGVPVFHMLNDSAKQCCEQVDMALENIQKCQTKAWR